MSRKLTYAGEEWEKAQQAKLIKAMEQGLPLHGVRDHESTMSAELVAEKECLDMIAVLFDNPVMWQLIPERNRTIEVQSLVFRLLGRLGCLVTQLLCFPNQKPDRKVFRLLKDLGVADELLATKHCVFSDSMVDLVQKHPTLTDPVCLAKLEAKAITSKAPVAHIESRHASIRKQLVGRSTQVGTSFG